MTRGAPDYSNVRRDEPFERSDDFGELAARLGSPITFDRRGNVVWFDFFEHGLAAWGIEIPGTGAACAISTVKAAGGAFSCLLTSGDAEGNKTSIHHSFPYAELETFGLEASLNFNAQVNYWLIEARVYDGDFYTQFAIRYYYDSEELQILDAVEGWHTHSDDLHLKYAAYLFHTVKLVFDIESGEYVRLIVDATEYDLSEYSAPAIGSGTIPQITLYIRNYGKDGYNGTMYVDNVIITQNEP